MSLYAEMKIEGERSKVAVSKKKKTKSIIRVRFTCTVLLVIITSTYSAQITVNTADTYAPLRRESLAFQVFIIDLTRQELLLGAIVKHHERLAVLSS